MRMENSIILAYQMLLNAVIHTVKALIKLRMECVYH